MIIPADTISPVTENDYDGMWHTSDLTITLTAVDDESGVAETYYQINCGPIKTVSVDGHPVITSEGASNTLEYWSLDNMGNEESHKMLMDVKLDKTSPTGSVLINNGASSTSATSVTLTLTATDETSRVYQVRFSNDGVWDTELWEPPQTSKAWTVTSGNGQKTVYYQLMDNAGLISATYSDTITLTSPPSDSGDSGTSSDSSSSSDATPSPTPSPSPSATPARHRPRADRTPTAARAGPGA